MALKWFETVNIMEREADLTRDKVEKGVNWLNEQRRVREEQFMQKMAKESHARAEAHMTYNRNLQRYKALNEINSANDELRKMGMPPMPTGCAAMDNQWLSGGAYVEQNLMQAKSSVRQAEEEMRADARAGLLKEGAISLATPAEQVEQLVEVRLAAQRSQQFFEAGDYDAAQYWDKMSSDILTGAVQLSYELDPNTGIQVPVYTRIAPEQETPFAPKTRAALAGSAAWVAEQFGAEGSAARLRQEQEYFQSPTALPPVAPETSTPVPGGGIVGQNLTAPDVQQLIDEAIDVEAVAVKERRPLTTAENLQSLDYRRRLLAWAKENGIEDPNAWLRQVLGQPPSSQEVSMRATTPEELAGLQEVPRPTSTIEYGTTKLDRILLGYWTTSSPTRKVQLYTTPEVKEVLGEAASNFPKQAVSSFLSVTLGMDGASAVDKGWSLRYIDSAGEDIATHVAKVQDMYPGIMLLEEIAQLPATTAYSVVTMGAGTLAALPLYLIPEPTGGTKLAAAGVTGVVSGLVAFRASSFQIMQEYLEFKNQEMIRTTGRGLTLAEETKLKDDFRSNAAKYGLWEAVPEGISNAVFSGIFSGAFNSALTKVVGKEAAQAIGGSLVGRVGSKALGIYGQELLTETITQKGQVGIEIKAGLRDENISWAEAFKEVAPQTFLLTTLMAGAGSTIVNTRTGITKIQAALKTEIGTTHPQYAEISAGVDEYYNSLVGVSDTVIGTKPAAGATAVETTTPAVTPTTPAATATPVAEATVGEVTMPAVEPAVATMPQAKLDLASDIRAAYTKLEGMARPNSIIGAKALDALEQKGVDVSDAREALSTYKETVRSDFDSAEDYSESRADAWQKFLSAVDGIGVEAVTPVAETTAHAEAVSYTGVAPSETEAIIVEASKPLSGIREIQRKYITKREDVAALKKELVDYVKAYVPKAAQGVMLNSVKNVKTERELSIAIDMANRHAETSVQKTLTAEIKKELASIKPKRVATGYRYGKFTVETQKALDEIKKNMGRAREDVRDEILKNIEATETGKMTPEDADAANQVLAYAGLKGMTSDELAYTLRQIKSLKDTGRGLRTAEIEADRSRLDKLRGDIINMVTGGKGMKPGVGTVDTRKMWVREGKLKSALTNWQYGIDDLADKVSRFDRSSKPFQSILNIQIVDRLHIARSVQDAGTTLWIDVKTANKMAEIYGTKGRRGLSNLLNHLLRDDIDLGAFQTTEGKTVRMVYTKDQLLAIHMALQDTTLDETFRIGMKWTDEMMSAVTDSLTSQDIAYARWLLESYQEYGQRVKPHWEKKFHIPMPENPMYSPLNRDLDNPSHDHILMARDNYRYAGVTAHSMKARVNNRIPLKFPGATATWVNHIIQMEHFMAFSDVMKDARAVFMNKDVRNAVRQYHGNDVLTHMDRHLDQIARDGLDKAGVVRALDTLRHRFTLASLGIKPMIGLKQLFSLPAYLTYEPMPLSDFFTGTADFWKHPLANMREMKALSGYLSERWGHGHERDVRLAMKQGVAGRLSNVKNWRDLIMMPIHGMDTITTMVGSWSVYKAMQKQGMSKQDAMTHAEIATKRSQPSFGLEDMAALRKQGSFWQLLTMFQSQPNKYYRIIASSVRNLKAGRGSKGRNILNLLLAWWILPSLFQYVSDAFEWKKEHQARVAILGPLNNILAAGNMIQTIWGWIAGESYPYQASPVFTTLDDMRWAITRTKKMMEDGQDPTKEIDTDYLVKTIEYYAEAAGQLTGVPTPYIIQVERAIRNADIRQMVFSEYALRGTTEQEAEKKAIEKLQTAFAGVRGKAKWSDLTKAEQDQFWLLRPDLKR